MFSPYRTALMTWSVIAVVACGAVSTQATVLNFQEGVSPDGTYAMDATGIRQGSGGSQVNTNYNGSDLLLIGRLNNLPSELNGLMEFNLSAITAAAAGNPIVVNSVQLKLTTATQAGVMRAGETFTLDVHAYGFDIDETTATWNNPGAGDATPGGAFGDLLGQITFDPIVDTDTVQTIGSTAAFVTAVEAALASPSKDLGLYLLSQNTLDLPVGPGGANQFARIIAESDANAAARPQLIVDFTVVPEPGSLTLLGLAGLTLFRRR